MNNIINDIDVSGTTLAHKPYPSAGMVGQGIGQPPFYNQNNKFNTISNIHKRGGKYRGRKFEIMILPKPDI